MQTAFGQQQKQGGKNMYLFKSAIVALALGLGPVVSADSQVTTVDTDQDAVLLFNTEDVGLDAEETTELEALMSEGDVDAYHDRDRGRRGDRFGIRRAVINCSSIGYGTTQCRVPGRIVSVRLARQFSSSRCISGRTFGAYRNTIWVSRGCRGAFQVRYRADGPGRGWRSDEGVLHGDYNQDQ